MIVPDFDAVTHTYRVNGHIVPSVTQVIGAVYPGLFDSIPPAVLQRKALLGTAVHAAIELYLNDELDGSTLHPAIVPYFESWLAWATEEIQTTLHLETIFASPLGYAGQVDWVGDTKSNGLCIVDWKTTVTPSRTHRIQTAGYALGLPAPEAKRGCLYLKGDGSPAVLDLHLNAKDVVDWTSTLRVFNLRKEM
jgi:hypothetical protein